MARKALCLRARRRKLLIGRLSRAPCESVGFPGPTAPGILLIHPTLSRTLKPKEPTMTIEIRDASLEARIRKQPQATGSSSAEEVLPRQLATTSVLSS
jgi:hypothetical protein